ncbi:S-adenosyl-L-methionine-dependent methyltransferase [Stachybotrys elegans]|uniref:tRNA wybutosine-synthesizing protein 2 n=1 Tax=Stachybotrys elegans TaxID=80388 RepID=A0A8K0SVK0_9HYPO|nr:S-adenosyl-L-methionine-dependent methyltransferase [Stachybotrys elegans]
MPKPAPPRQKNLIQAAIEKWLEGLPAGVLSESDDAFSHDDLLAASPKRYTVYEPMVLLATGSFGGSAWTSTLSRCPPDYRSLLWDMILQGLGRGSKTPLTHLAINEGIPLQKDGEELENILRSPSGLHLLYGDFGPEGTRQDGPSMQDFDEAFWVSTKQNGIYQTWAPRWTMFSRGNVKEKARLLEFEPPQPRRHTEAAHCWAADLYAGIGYFVFCYASLGFKVVCWEINPWSVEGLRRGAEINRWSVKVIGGQDLQRSVDELMAGGEQITVFLEDNNEALGRIQQMWSIGIAQDIRHVNCGFLPTSEPTWEQAWAMTSKGSKASLHLHENVGVEEVESRRGSIQRKFEEWSLAEGAGRRPSVEHVELVKTFAPGVWHCVFDVGITRSNDTG